MSFLVSHLKLLNIHLNHSGNVSNCWTNISWTFIVTILPSIFVIIFPFSIRSFLAWSILLYILIQSLPISHSLLLYQAIISSFHLFTSANSSLVVAILSLYLPHISQFLSSRLKKELYLVITKSCSTISKAHQACNLSCWANVGVIVQASTLSSTTL